MSDDSTTQCLLFLASSLGTFLRSLGYSDLNLQPSNEPSNSIGSQLTQTDRGKVQLLSSTQRNVAIMSCITQPQCVQILCLDALRASKARSGVSICGAELSKLPSC